jgi:Tfp pilus assembly protein PilZ
MGPNRTRWSTPPPAPSGPAQAGARSPSPTQPGGHAPGAGPGKALAPFRAHARKTARIQSIVTHLQAVWQHQAAVVNIGLGGACICVDDALAVGDIVTLSFTAPTLWDPLVLTASVAWVAAAPGPGSRTAGVAFEHKATDAVFALYELIVALGYE